MDVVQAIQEAHLEGYDIRLVPAPAREINKDKICLKISLGEAHSYQIISPYDLQIPQVICNRIKEGKKAALECYNENKAEA